MTREEKRIAEEVMRHFEPKFRAFQAEHGPAIEAAAQAMNATIDAACKELMGR